MTDKEQKRYSRVLELARGDVAVRHAMMSTPWPMHRLHAVAVQIAQTNKDLTPGYTRERCLRALVPKRYPQVDTEARRWERHFEKVLPPELDTDVTAKAPRPSPLRHREQDPPAKAKAKASTTTPAKGDNTDGKRQREADSGPGSPQRTSGKPGEAAAG